jgi:predicted amidohydrolase YtcJ
MRPLLLRAVEVDGRLTDVRVAGGVVAAVTLDLVAGHDDLVVDGAGGALIPGLHDHHLHLLAAAAALRSVNVGPPAVTSPTGFAAALRAAAGTVAPGEWVRAVGYHTSVAGDLDRHTIDAAVADRSVRVQDRSGARWTLNSAGCRATGLEGPDGRPTGPLPEGIELDVGGRATGRITRADRWLRHRLPAAEAPDLTGLGRRLAGLGVTGVTDATPVEKLDDLRVLADAALPQHVQVMGGPALSAAAFPPGLAVGPVKVVLSDHRLPGLDELTGWLRTAHRAGRPVAVHCVTRAALVLALAAWDEVGVRDGDRIEHASVVPTELVGGLAERRLVVVTQPGFVADRGDRYLADVDADDVDHLYRCASLRAAGVRVGGSTDAPFGPLDPWAAIAAAIDRCTPSGAPLGPDEALDPRSALGLFLTPLDDPGGSPRRVRAGVPADLVLLDGPLDRVLRRPSSDTVVATVIGGVLARG